MAVSRHLEQIITKHHNVTHLQVIFVDVEKYSKRRTQTQAEVIEKFTDCLREGLTEVSKDYIDYSQVNDINLREDTIVIPTGDGAAVGFSFDGIHDIHLRLGLKLLSLSKELRQEDPCEKFDEHGWCNCHPYFNLRIGISEGRAIVYRDVNDTTTLLAL